ncbi:MAG: hypothetical protein FWG53_06590 [Clostridiales bacterium]|nr:hypothetical protein [Clostridiales bacterium]
MTRKPATLAELSNVFRPGALTEEEHDLYQPTAAVRGGMQDDSIGEPYSKSIEAISEMVLSRTDASFFQEDLFFRADKNCHNLINSIYNRGMQPI